MKVGDLIKELERYDKDDEVHCPIILYGPDDQCSCSMDDEPVKEIFSGGHNDVYIR